MHLRHGDRLAPGPGTDRSNGRSVLLSTDAGATWTDQTGDARTPGESMHPDQHAVAFVPSNPDAMFLGSDGGVIRTSGTYTDASSQCDTRGLGGVFLTDCKAWLKPVPTRLDPVNAGLATLQLYSIAVNPNDSSQALAGTQDNGSLNFTGSDTWLLGVTGDGGDAGFDAVDPNTQFHTYYVGWLDVNFRGEDPKTWLWIGDQFFPSAPAGESIRMYPPTIPDPVHVERSSRAHHTSGGRRTPAATRRSSRPTARRRTSSVRATCSSRARAATSSRSARRSPPRCWEAAPEATRRR